MPTELNVHVVHQGGMKSVASAGAHSVVMDYPNAAGEREGMTPLELLLASLAGCGIGGLAVLLRRSEQRVTGIEAHARGVRRDEHPTVITSIDLKFTVRGEGLDRDAVEHALKLAEQRICPVWAMVAPGTPIAVGLEVDSR